VLRQKLGVSLELETLALCQKGATIRWTFSYSGFTNVGGSSCLVDRQIAFELGSSTDKLPGKVNVPVR
jgi:hypothetical protein